VLAQHGNLRVKGRMAACEVHEANYYYNIFIKYYK
jgi:hypothetical protein